MNPRPCRICGKSVDYADKHRDAGHAYSAEMHGPIDPRELRKGDRVRITDVTEITVTAVDADYVHDGHSVWPIEPNRHLRATRTWELLDRPKPEARLGSMWVDPEDGSEWVALRGGNYVHANLDASTIGPETGRRFDIIARLVPAEDAS